MRGATVGYVTDLKITTPWPGRLLGNHRYVWTAKGKVPLELNWVGEKRLEVVYPAGLRPIDVVRNETRWKDVEIIYVPKTM